MWPNSCLPNAMALITAAQAGSQGQFMLEGVENHTAFQRKIVGSKWCLCGRQRYFLLGRAKIRMV